MTDTSSRLATHPLPQPYPVTAASLASPTVNGSQPDANLLDEEDYTIKCICIYADDDGNTVLCEKCETWQHIECYYHGKKVPDVHFCADCEPRPLDGKRATERQKRLRELSDGGDRNKKRPTSKSHKKKVKDPNGFPEQANGWHGHERHDSTSAGKDQPPAKRPKTSHRTSSSVASMNGTPGLTESRKRAFSNLQSYPSPTKSPPDHLPSSSIPLYTLDFLELYDRDEGKDNVSADAENFHRLNITTRLFEWQRNPSLLAEETRRHDIENPFIHLDKPLDRSTWPRVSLEFKKNTEIEIDGRNPSWRYLQLQTDVRKNEIVGEIKGQIGDLAEYCQDLSNRWQELRHPEPFVFFHPSLPIYIDSRREGTQFRYIRRSCHPNVTLRTYVTSDRECHYCFVAIDNLTAGTELTAQWYMDRLNQADRLDELDWRFDWASRLLANFGDCACDKSEPCRLAKLDRRRLPRAIEANAKQSHSKKRKTKNKQAISPLSTGQATNSRAGSENIKVQEEDDSQSISGSSRSKSQSRDLTPTNVASLDADPVLGAGLTARERRKIAMAEKAFAEQDNTNKRKKRTSGGSMLNTPSANTSNQLGYGSSSLPSTPNFLSKSSYTDTGTSNRFSGSPPPLKTWFPRKTSNQSHRKTSAPNTPSLLSPNSRASYVDIATQTEPDDLDCAESPPFKRRRYTTPNQRLLKRVLDDRARFDQQRTDSITTPSPVTLSPGVTRLSEDVEMKDVPASSSSPQGSPVSTRRLSESPSSSANAVVNAPTSPLPSQAAHSYTNLHPPNGQRLQLINLPPVPSFPGSNSATTPASAGGPVTQSPFSFAASSSSYPGLSGPVATPSPVKKKLSLGDYMSRKSNLATTPTVEKTQAQSLLSMVATASTQDPTLRAHATETSRSSTSSMPRPDESIKKEVEAMGGNDGSAIVDVPLADDPDKETLFRTVSAPQILGSSGSNNSVSATRPMVSPSGAIAPEIANVLSTLNAMMPVSGSQRSHSASSS